LIDHKKKNLKIIDWGLAEFYLPDKTLHRVGTKYFVPPELICGYKYYNYQVDIWSLGCIFAGIVNSLITLVNPS
jgi:casein kinase II subunit alpha